MGSTPTIFSGATLDLGTFTAATTAGLSFIGGGTLTGTGTSQFTLGNNLFYQTILGGETTATIDTRLALSGAPLLNIARGQNEIDMVINGVISAATGTVALTKTGAGILKLTNINTYTGATQVQMGTLLLDYRTNNGSIIPAGGLLALGSGSTTTVGTNGHLVLIGSDSSLLGPTVQTVANTQFVIGGGNTIELRPQSQDLTLNLGGIDRQAGSTVNFIVGTGNAGVGTITTTSLNNLGGILGPYAVFGGRDWAVAGNGSPAAIGPLTSYVNDTYTTGTNVNVTMDATIPANATVGTLRFDTAAPITLTLGGRFTAPGILVTPNVGANTITISGGNMIGTTAAVGELIIHQYNTAAPLILSTNVQDQTTTTAVTQLIKTGPGTLILTGFLSSLTGGIRIQEGTLKFGISGPLTSFTSNTAARHIFLYAGATLDASDITVTNTALLSVGGPGRVLLGNTGSYTIGDNGSAGTFSHTLVGGANSVFSKQSVATTTVNGDNINFEGTFRIRNGGISLASDMSWGSPTATISLENGVGNEWITPYAARMFVTASFATTTGKKIILNGKAGNRHAIDVAAGATFTMNGVISGVAGMFKTSTGTMILTAANTFEGALQIESGVLTLGGDAGSLTVSPRIIINNLSTLTFDATTAPFSGGGSRLGAMNSEVVINGGNFTILGNSGDSTELLNVLRLAGGPAVVTVIPANASAVLQLTNTTSGLVRDALTSNATVLFRGQGLGSGSAGTAKILIDAGIASQLVGGGGADGSTSISILPYAIGDATNSGLGDSFVTYGQYGIRPLNTATEYATYAAAAATDNVRYISGATMTGKTINSIVFAPTAVLSITGSGNLNVTSGAMLFNGTVATTLTGFAGINFGNRQGVLWINNTATAGVTISGGMSGTGGLVKAGAGKLTITGASTYTGLTSINGGTLVVNHIAALGPNPSLAVESGGTFDLANSTVASFTIDGLTSTDFSGGTVAIGTKTLIVGINGAGGTYSGNITGTGTLIKEGSGELVFNNLLSFTGPTIINGGMLTIIREASNLGTTNNFSAPVTVNPGATFHVSYQQNSTNAGPFANTGSITLNNGTLAISNLNTATSNGGLNSNGPSYSSITLSTGMNIIKSMTTGSIDTTSVVATSLVRNNRSTLVIQSETSLGSRAIYRLPSLDSATNNVNFVGGLATTGTNRSIVPYIVLDSNFGRTGATFVTLVTSGTTTNTVTPLPLGTTGYATYSAATAQDNVRITASATGQTGKTINALLLDASSAAYSFSGSGSLDITSGAIIFSGTQNITVSGFSGLTTGATSAIVNEYIFHVANLATVTLNVPLTTTGNAFTKSSAGTLVFGAANLYSGPTTLNAGTLSVAQSSFLGDGSATNTLVFSGGTLATTGTFATARDMAFNIGGGTVSVANSTTLTLSGATSGTGGLTKAGPGLLAVSSNIAYTGKTTVREGTFSPTGGIAATSGAVTVGGAGLAARMDISPAGTINAPVTIAAQGMLAGSGTVNANLTVGPGGTITPGDAAIATISSAAGKTVTFSGGGTFIFEVDNVIGTAGTDWDFLSSIGTLQITATSADPFHLRLTGDGVGFNPSAGYTGIEAWNFARYDSLVGFDENAFVIDTVGVFASGPTAAGRFFVSNIGNDLYLNYAAVPEPGSLALISLASFAFWWQRRRRKAKEAAAEAGTIPEEVTTIAAT
ncbi:MAG: autotransporter-associated beta strand repeat-containing protein [Pirellulales bacterium]